MKKWLFTGFIALACAVIVYAATGTIVTWTGMGSRRNTVEFTIESASIGSAAAFLPGTDNTNALGSASKRFSNIYAAAATIDSPITATASLTVVRSTAPRTAVGVAALYAAYTIPAGTLFIDSTNNVLCMSSGTAQTSITVSTGTGACPS